MDKKEIINAIENSYKYTSQGFLIDHNILADKILALSQPKEVEPKKEVDLDELKGKLADVMRFHVSNTKQHEIWELFIPHLQKPVESEWISVEDRLPKIEATYLVTLKSDTDTWIETAYLFNGVFSLGGHRISDKITHWMPLPQPPKNNSNN